MAPQIPLALDRLARLGAIEHVKLAGPVDQGRSRTDRDSTRGLISAPGAAELT